MTSNENANSPPRSNVPEMSVSELSFSLKRTLEETYGRVRVRGELSRISMPRSGHMYADIKDENALINTVCWKGVLSKLSVKPEEGLEVICTGRISTYPARSNYQLIIESMELAGEGALLKMLEERRKKLAAEGLFAAERKKNLPFLPEVIGVVTSPTGAVIRDILHRLDDRFPRHVLVWPVLVQGPGAAEQIARAVRGFDALAPGGAVKRPDLLIVARGGGSLEDLMAFNEEEVVRAIADCSIPVISAVGHETDTTLADYAADLRAPTPTGAAEKAVPVRADILAWTLEQQQRLLGGLSRLLNDRRNRLATLEARLGDPARLLENRQQRTDHLAHKLSSLYERDLAARRARLGEAAARLRHPRDRISDARSRLSSQSRALVQAGRARLRESHHRLSLRVQRLRTPEAALREAARALETPSARLARTRESLLREKRQYLDFLSQRLESVSFENVLQRGFVVVYDAQGSILKDAGQAQAGQRIDLRFHGQRHVAAQVTGSDQQPAADSAAKKPPASKTAADQGDLF